MKSRGDSHLNIRGNPLRKPITFFRTKQFVQKNICSLHGRDHIFVQDCCRTPYGVRGFKSEESRVDESKLWVALHMECVDLSGESDSIPITNYVALHMECVDLSSHVVALSLEGQVAPCMGCVDSSYSFFGAIIFVRSHSARSAWI